MMRIWHAAVFCGRKHCKAAVSVTPKTAAQIKQLCKQKKFSRASFFGGSCGMSSPKPIRPPVCPPQTLQDHGIEVHSDLAGVGANLQDHPGIVMALKVKPDFDMMTISSQIYNKSNNIRIGAVLQYLFGRKGPLTTTGCDHGAFVSTTGKAGAGAGRQAPA